MGTQMRPRGIIIDDDSDFVKSVVYYLGKLGIELVATHTLAEFAQALDGPQPDFCLIDMNLGEVTAGYALVMSIRSKLQWKIPLIIMSRESDLTAVTRAIELGATDYILKPVNRDLLAAKLSGFLTSPELSQAEIPYAMMSPDEGELTLSLDVELIAVDELGITLRGKSLFTKGSLLKLQSELLTEITGRSEAHLFTVADTVLGANEAYQTYCEFENPREGELGSIRRWIGSKKANP